ncbi:MAG: hypothetical protein HYU67_13300 [Flavobacteriia bacterium]|nr:hypothetical protein [Flavobacteriia bacterium]
MHFIEPFSHWRVEYIASEDPLSPFYGKVNSEIEFTDKIYNYYIHPQWDSFGSPTLFLKILFVDYDSRFAIIELIGEWNDAIENDIMTLKRDLIEDLIHNNICQFILIGENVLNFHYSDDSYYEEWFDDIEDGWIALINFHDHVLQEFKKAKIDQYLAMEGDLNDLDWRTYLPINLYEKVLSIVQKRIN